MAEITAKFVTSSYGNRSGFVHEATITTSEGKTANSHIQYHNRTWEPYPFYSAKIIALENLISSEVNDDCVQYRNEHNLNRLPRGFKKERENFYKQKYAKIFEQVRRY